MQFPNMVDLAIPFFGITLLLEALLSRFRSDIDYELKDTLASITMGVGNVLVGSTVGMSSTTPTYSSTNSGFSILDSRGGSSRSAFSRRISPTIGSTGSRMSHAGSGQAT